MPGHTFACANAECIKDESGETTLLIPFCNVRHDYIFGHIELRGESLVWRPFLNIRFKPEFSHTPAERMIAGPRFSAGYSQPRSVTPLSVLNSIASRGGGAIIDLCCVKLIAKEY